MAKSLEKFPHNDIISLTAEEARYDLAESVGPDLRLKDLLDGAAGDLADLPLAYGSPAGRADLRQAIAMLHDVQADEVITTVGGMHALFLLATVLCAPGDEVVLTSPGFPNTRTVFASTGAQIRTLALSFEDNYRLSVAALEEQLSPKTSLVCLTSPQNPSGVTTPTETIAKILQRMQAVCPDAYLLIDETYREAAYGNNAVVPSPAYLSRRIISCASLSKCRGAPGLRLGWLIVRDPALRQQLILAKFNTVISCSAIDEALALRVLERSGTILNERRERLREGLARVADWVAAESKFVEWVRPDAGALCCIRLRPSAFEEDAVARFYQELTREQVRVARGDWFGETPRVFRLGFGLLKLEDLEIALSRVSEVLRRL